MKLTPTAVALTTLQQRISEIESRANSRQEVLSKAVYDARQRASIEMNQLKAKCATEIAEKDDLIRQFRKELDALLRESVVISSQHLTAPRK